MMLDARRLLVVIVRARHGRHAHHQPHTQQTNGYELPHSDLLMPEVGLYRFTRRESNGAQVQKAVIRSRVQATATAPIA